MKNKKEVIYKKYIKEKKSLTEIGKELNLSPETIWYHIHKYNIPIRSISESLKIKYKKGLKPYWKGRKNKKLSIWLKKAYKSGKVKLNSGIFKKGEHRGKSTEFRKGDPRHKDKKFQQYRLEQLNKKPNKLELKFIEIMKENNLPFKYVGNGSLLIGYKNPDFIFKNKIIELFGHYHKNPPYWHQTDKGCIKYYTKYGYKTLIIWSNRIRNKDIEPIVKRVKNFLENGRGGIMLLEQW